MKILKELTIYFGITFISEIIAKVLPINIPASIIGIAILFTLLETGILKMKDVEKTGNFLINVMPILFIPAGVSLIKYLDVLEVVAIPMALVVTISTVIVMVVVGRVVEKMVEKRR